MDSKWIPDITINNKSITAFELSFLSSIRPELFSKNFTSFNRTAVQLLFSNHTFVAYFLEKLPRIPIFNEMSMIKTVVLSCMFVVAFIGNTATLVQMYRMRRRKSTINLLLLHLAIADLLVTFFCIVSEAVWASTIQWFAGNFMCKLVKFLQVFGLYLSTYIIVIIALDRCLAILDPMSRNRAPRRVRTMITVAWIMAGFFSTPQVIIFKVERGPFPEDFFQCVTYGTYSQPWQEQLYSCLSVGFMFIIPLVAMVSAYMLIFHTIAKKSRDFQRGASDMLSRGPVRGQLFRKAKVKSLRMTAVIVVAFIVCWTPYFVILILHTFSSNKLDEKSSLWIFFFGMANSMINPLIYRAFQISKNRKRKR
uniref:G-protein coupled receptors family 1 profile domain-containing protein n=1 Tax=Capitella teleta TaxID=283909 RepID=X1YZA9_CAPTE